MKKYIAILMAIACAAALLLTGCGQNNDPQPDPQLSGLTGSVATDGSTSMQKVINTLGEAFMNENKGITFTYNPTGSGSGIKAVQEGRCDIGLSSRALKAEEKEAGLKETVLAYDGIAIIVNPENPVSDLTLGRSLRSTPAGSPTGRTLAAMTPRSFSSAARPAVAPAMALRPSPAPPMPASIVRN